MGYVCQKNSKENHIDVVSCQIFPDVPDFVETKYDMPIFFSTPKQKRTSNLQRDIVYVLGLQIDCNILFFIFSLQIVIMSNNSW